MTVQLVVQGAATGPAPGGGSLASLCQRQQRCVKASMVSAWRLAEAQHQLCSLGLHGSESQEQERARASACPSELSLTEEEWRRKEGMLGGGAPCDASHSPVLGAVASWDVFDKSIINAPQTSPSDRDQDRSKNFIQTGDATATPPQDGGYQGGGAARLDPKDVLESLPQYAALRSRGDATATPPQDGGYQGGGAARLDPKDVLESLPQVAEYHVKRCLDAGLWTRRDPKEDLKEDSVEADDARMMEMS
ncbi:hypothetical protein CRUP_025007 [Coryphaenoides rupestris]|nr:hypothetical protein CRUP_025007 [Coryphaenoides rupestris]